MLTTVVTSVIHHSHVLSAGLPLKKKKKFCLESFNGCSKHTLHRATGGGFPFLKV